MSHEWYISDDDEITATIRDKSDIVPGEIGSKVVAKVAIDRFNNGKNVVPIGTKGIILKKENTKEFLNRYPKAAIWVGDAENFYDIKWKIGGHMPQVLDTWIEVL